MDCLKTMLKRERYAKEFNKITLHCFDLMKYKKDIDRLNMSVWLNFRGETYYSGDILVNPHSFCTWNNHQWVLKQGQDLIKIRGIQQIMDFLEVNYEEKPDGTTKL